MHRALKYVVIVSTLVALQACGGPSTGEVAESGKGGVQCEDLPSYTCDEYPEQCRPDEADVLFLGLQCYGETGLAFACSERSECVEAEWFAEVGLDTYVVRGCINHQRSGMTWSRNPLTKWLHPQQPPVTKGSVFSTKTAACLRGMRVPSMRAAGLKPGKSSTQNEGARPVRPTPNVLA